MCWVRVDFACYLQLKKKIPMGPLVFTMEYAYFNGRINVGLWALFSSKANPELRINSDITHKAFC